LPPQRSRTCLMTRTLKRRSILVLLLGMAIAGAATGKFAVGRRARAEEPAARAEAAPKEKPITAEDRRHWAFVPPVRPAVPAVTERGWGRTPIDAFILPA